MTTGHTVPHDIPILYWDDQVLAVDKPAGLLAVPGRGPDKQDCVLHQLERNWGRLGVVHRLDQATSGVLLFARTDSSLRVLHHQFREKTTHKRYLAVVRGVPTPASDTITLSLMADWPNRPRQKVDPDLGKPSITHYRTLASDPLYRFAWLELQPITGRTHQLRVHLMHRGHPILGDTLYGGDTPSDRALTSLATRQHPLDPRTRMLLHANTLTWNHPVTGLEVNTVAPCPFTTPPDAHNPPSMAGTDG